MEKYLSGNPNKPFLVPLFVVEADLVKGVGVVDSDLDRLGCEIDIGTGESIVVEPLKSAARGSDGGGEAEIGKGVKCGLYSKSLV